MTLSEKITAIELLIATDGERLTDGEVVDGIMAVLEKDTTRETLEIPLSYYDIEQAFPQTLQGNRTLDWEFETNTGQMVNIIFMTEDEYTQRRV